MEFDMDANVKDVIESLVECVDNDLGDNAGRRLDTIEYTNTQDTRLGNMRETCCKYCASMPSCKQCILKPLCTVPFFEMSERNLKWCYTLVNIELENALE